MSETIRHHCSRLEIIAFPECRQLYQTRGSLHVQASGVEDHWSVREEAARVAALVCSKYGEPYYQIQPRITQALNTAFQQTNNPLTTHYGISCLSVCGQKVLTFLLHDCL